MEELPNEIMIKILSYLPTIDLIQFVRAYEDCSCFLKERHVVRVINFKKMFHMSDFDVCNFIKTNVGYKYIKVLDIDSFYWIPLNDLRMLLSVLDSLEELYALDTKLGLSEQDVILYGRLKKLSITVEASNFDAYPTSDFYFNALYSLKKLLLKLITKKEHFEEIYVFFSALSQLTELWLLDNDEDHGICYDRIVANFPKLTKFVVKSQRPVPMLDFSVFGLFKIFQNKRYESSVEYIFERISLVKRRALNVPQEPIEPLEEAWKTFKMLHADFPCGPRDFEFSGDSINDLYFEDLNFSHVVVLCNLRYIKAAWQILLSRNATRLKRLGLRTCLFQTLKEIRSPSVTFEDLPCLLRNQNDVHPFVEIAKNIKSDLKVLDIGLCSGNVFNEAYFAISCFESLERLNLEVDPELDGKFLKEVFTKCKKLKSVSFSVLNSNEIFLEELYESMKCATSLRDFRLECREVSIINLLSSFNGLTFKKIVRMYIKCDSFRSTSKSLEIQSFSHFLENNTQLIFLFLIITKNSTKENSDIQNTLNKFKIANPVKIYYVRKELPLFKGIFPILPAHHDIMFNEPVISAINPDEF